MVVPGRETAREPDLAVYQEPLRSELGQLAWKHTVPCLVVEVVSKGQEYRDYKQKRKDYWDAGIAEYWIVDSYRKGITVLTRGRVKWKEAFYGRSASFRSPNLEGLSVRMKDVLAE